MRPSSDAPNPEAPPETEYLKQTFVIVAAVSLFYGEREFNGKEVPGP
jgi:hypothetical protein